jgi:hypothetical protein
VRERQLALSLPQRELRRLAPPRLRAAARAAALQTLRGAHRTLTKAAAQAAAFQRRGSSRAASEGQCLMATDLVAEQRLLANIKTNLSALEALMERARSEWQYEDFVYRFYHQSFKVFGVQSMTLAIVAVLRDLLPEVALNACFRRSSTRVPGTRSKKR